MSEHDHTNWPNVEKHRLEKMRSWRNAEWDQFADRFEFIRDENKRLEDENEKMRHTLDVIANPLKHIALKARGYGMTIDAQTAIQLTQQPNYFQTIAQQALFDIKKEEKNGN